MAKKLIRLTEGDLHRVVKESVKRILNEVKWTDSNGTEHSSHGWYGNDEDSKFDAAHDFSVLGHEREKEAYKNDPMFGVKVRDLNAAEFLRLIKQGVDFTNAELNDTVDILTGGHHPNWENITPEEWKKWMKNTANSNRNYSIYNDLTGDEEGAKDFKGFEKTTKNTLKGGYDNAISRFR
jgi:hypothetical protein